MGKPFRISDRFKSFKYAWKGIISLFRSEHNAYIHLAAVILVTVAGFYFDITKNEWIAVVLCFGIVLAAEAFNTAIEQIVDYISLQRHPIAGKIKDLAAGGVLLCAVAAAVVGLIIFIPYIIN